jgi:hypothetical protein
MLHEELGVAPKVVPVSDLERGHERHSPELERHGMQQLWALAYLVSMVS